MTDTSAPVLAIPAGQASPAAPEPGAWPTRVVMLEVQHAEVDDLPLPGTPEQPESK
jgi:hypothetical protein